MSGLPQGQVLLIAFSSLCVWFILSCIFACLIFFVVVENWTFKIIQCANSRIQSLPHFQSLLLLLFFVVVVYLVNFLNNSVEPVFFVMCDH